MADTKQQWQLDDIVTLEEFPKLLATNRKAVKKYDEYFKKMSPDMEASEFLKFIDFAEQIGISLSRLYHRAELMESTDQKSSEAKALKEHAKDLSIELGEAGRKVYLWLKGKEVAGKPRLDDTNAARLFAVTGDREYSLHFMRRNAHYSLEEQEENIISLKDANGAAVLTDLRDIIATEQRYTLKVPGEKPRQIETSSEVIALAYSPDAQVREASYRALYAAYESNLDKYFMVYQAIVKDWASEAKLRGYESSIAVRNRANHVPDQAIEVLMSVCSDQNELFQRYFVWKANKLGLPRLRRFDIYAPLETVEGSMSYDEALAMVMEVFTEFSPQFAAHAKRIVDDHHIDSHPSGNKRSGAFCATVSPDISPYVLLNHTGKLRDVSTIAHELGHGVHSLYAAKHSSSVQSAGLPLAETASTFGEMILFERLLERTNNAAERESLLADKISDWYAGIMRQNYFVKFELAAHEKIPAGTTQAELGEMWLATLHEQFGDAVEVDPIFAMEWAYIPHILHTPFYCYAYNFGELLSLALYARYKKEGKSFVPTIERLLSAGGAEEPDALLKSVGIDMSDARFWQGSFEIIANWVAELEKTS